MKSSIIWDITPCSLLKSSSVLESYISLTYRVEEYTKQEINMKQVAAAS
jgi:hypothetical protein